MKKRASLITALALTASILTGCAGGTNSESSSTAESTSQTTSATTTSENNANEPVSDVETSAAEELVSEETQQEPTEETKPEENVVTELKFTAQSIGSETSPYRVISADSDGTYLALYYDVNDNYSTKAAVLNSDLTLKETLTGELAYSKAAAPVCLVLDKASHKYTLWINGKTYEYGQKEVKGDKFFYVNNDIVAFNEEYFSIDGEKLDYPYHGTFTDGHCFYVEDGKTMCMDTDGTVTDYTEQVKPIMDAGKQVISMINDTYFVAKADSDRTPTWYDKDGNEVITGYPVEVNGKYIFDGFACVQEYDQIFYSQLAEPHNKSADATQGNMGMLGVREWGSDSVLLSGGYLFNSDGESTKASDFLYSNFYNGAALSTSGGKAAFINTKFEIISEMFETANQSMTAEYIGNGQFCLGGSMGYYLLTPEF